MGGANFFTARRGGATFFTARRGRASHYSLLITHYSLLKFVHFYVPDTVICEFGSWGHLRLHGRTPCVCPPLAGEGSSLPAGAGVLIHSF